MTWRYRNRNSDQEVSLEQRSARLDHLPNWVLVSQPPEVPASGPETEDGASRDGDAGPVEPPKRPARSAGKAKWATYARAVATSDDERAEIAGMTAEQLIERYGTEPPPEAEGGEAPNPTEEGTTA
jgi:hypothetical protein